MRQISRVLAVSTLLLAGHVHANLCNKVEDTNTESATKKDIDFYTQLFSDKSLQGNRNWNEMVLECNRKRDHLGNEISKVTATDSDNSDKRLLQSNTLAPKVIRGNFNFLGFASFDYVYVLSKTNGEWQLTIPYAPIINDIVKDRIDFNLSHAYVLYEPSQVVNPNSTKTSLKNGALPIKNTLCSTSTFFPGKADKYDNASGENLHKRDKENQYISLGLLEYSYEKGESPEKGCRVDRNKDLFWWDPASNAAVKVKPDDWVLDNFARTAEAYWTVPGVFQLKILLKGHNESRFSSDVLNLLKPHDHLTVHFATKFLPQHMNQMYKSNAWQLNNFSTMTTDGTYWHEVGHAFGLDDEYGGKNEKKDETVYKDNGCRSDAYAKMNPQATYQMCYAGLTSKRTVYHYLAVSRYITKQNECSADIACPDGQYCDKGTITLGKNQCVAKKANTDGCASGDQCQSGQCSLGHCYQPNSAAMGETCFQDGACSKGKCTAVDGFAGKCVCQNDSDCGTGQWCNAGLDFKTNACHAKLNSGEKCGNGNAFGNDHKCKSGKCSGFPGYKCK